MPGFTLRTEDSKIVFTAPYGPKGATAAGGGPILTVVPRPERKSLTEWSGREPYSMNIDFALDNYIDGEGVPIEQEFRKLERLMGIDEGDPEPPKVIVLGDPRGSVPHDLHDNSRARWWVESVTIDDEKTLRNSHGNRVRIFGTVKLTEVVEGELLTVSSAAASKKSVGQNRYTVKKGDTLMSIASKKKIKGGWRTLAKLNKIRDPRKLRVGQVIRLK